MTLNFEVIGVDQITDDPTIRIRCSTNDGESIFAGSDSVNSEGHVWQYKNNSWTKITQNLSYSGFRGVHSITKQGNTLYVGTGGDYAANNTGKVWKNSGSGWENTGLSNEFSTSIRKLIKIQNDIFAAGSLAYVWKLTNNTWSDAGFLSFPNVANWVDLETDGTNLYGISLNSDGNQISGVIRFDGLSWQQISSPKFGDADNYFISKLYYANNRLYAATFNIKTGTEIWQYFQSSWSKIGDSGLGTKNNFNVADIKFIDNKLYVSIENPTGGQIWEYSPESGWQQQNINFNAKYNSYLIESVNSINYLIGKQVAQVSPASGLSTVYTAQQRIEKGLGAWPDNIWGAIPLGNGNYRTVGSNAYRIVVTEGPLNDPARVVLSPTGTLAGLRQLTDEGAIVKFQDILGLKSDAVSGQLGQVFDKNLSYGWEPENLSGIVYRGGGPIYKDEENGIILNPYYTEEGYWTIPQTPEAPGGAVGQIRLAVSRDDGLTFSDCGSILKSKALPSPNSEFNVNVYPYPFGLIRNGDYFYLYFGSDWNSSSISDATPLGVARAPYSEVITSALNTDVSIWNKYFNGSFSQPALDGSSTSLVKSYLQTINNVNCIYYSEKSNKYLNFFLNPLIVLDSNLYYFEPGTPKDTYVSISNDGINFGYPQRVYISERGANYIGLLGGNTHVGDIGDSFSIFATSGEWAAETWRTLTLASISLSTLDDTNTLRSYTESPYHFSVIGVDQITTDPTIKFRCSTNDGESIFVGSDSIKSSGHVWQYKDGVWSKITDNLEYQGVSSVNSILNDGNTLYVGTGGKYLDYGKGQVWKNYGIGWRNTNLQFPFNANCLIRKLLKVNEDIYAAGSIAYIYKLSNNEWSEVYPGGVNVFNYTDLETDGQNVYAAANSIDVQLVSGILKFDGNSWSAISEPGFGVSSNQLVTKLEYFNNKLYAGTFNEISGCEVWEYNNTSWNRIASGGLGDKNNFKVFDMKSNQTDLIVSIENPTGGQVWIYNTVDGWRNISINSNVKYDSYLIESFGTNNYLIGTQTMRFTPDTSTTIKYTAAERIAASAHYWPDGSFSPVPVGNGQYRFIGSNAYRPIVTQGPLDDPMQSVLSPASSYDLFYGLGNTSVSSKFQQFLELKPDAVSGQLGQIFDLTNSSGIAYFGAGVNYVDEDTGIVLHFYHTEEGYWTMPVIPGTSVRPPGGWESDIRQAVSFDNGLTYYDCGSVIKCAFSASPTGPLTQSLGETFAGVRKVGNYLYGYYWTDISGSNPQTDSQALSLIRAPYDEVIQYAQNKEVSPNWTKYYNGSFSQPGQKGLASDLFNNPYLVPVRRHSGTFYSSSLDKLANFITNPLTVLDSNLYVYKPGSFANIHVMLSDDGFNFGYPQRLDVTKGGYNYISVIGASAHKGFITDETFIYGTYGSSVLSWTEIALSKLNVSSLPIANIDRSFSVNSYTPSILPNFDLYIKDASGWQKAIPYTKISNDWKLSLPFSKINTKWSESTPIKEGREEVDLYFYIGDSVAAGDSGSAIEFLMSNEYSGLYSSVPGCYVFRTTESPQTTGEFGPFTGYRFEEIRTGVNTNPIAPNENGVAGADIVLFHKLRQQSNRDIYVIKYGLGGARWCREQNYLDWSPRSGEANEDLGDLFKSYINFLVIPALAVLKDSGKSPIFKGGFITLGTNYPNYIGKQEFTKQQIDLDTSGLVSGLISEFYNNKINTDSAKIVWIAPDRIRLSVFANGLEEPTKSDYIEYLNATVSSILNISSIFNFASGYDPSAWASLSNTGDYSHPSTSGHIKIGETVFNNFFYTGL